MRALEALFMPALVVHTSVAALYHPTPRAAYLEHILVDNWGAHASNFSSAMTPCSKYVIEVGRPALKSGRMTAAQWMRVAFHDFVTADVRVGTGGSTRASASRRPGARTRAVPPTTASRSGRRL